MLRAAEWGPAVVAAAIVVRAVCAEIWGVVVFAAAATVPDLQLYGELTLAAIPRRGYLTQAAVLLRSRIRNFCSRILASTPRMA
ncbi:MAG: hypothetical protein ACKO2L_03325 [Planctomycetaceae bacterium]